jgi:hypothetical protein
VVDGFAMEQFLFGSWYVCWGTKPAPVEAALADAVPQLIAAE